MSIFDTGTGIKGDPFKIYTEDDLFELAESTRKHIDWYHYQLQNDITLTRDWTPIGGTATSGVNGQFRGHFDGNGYTIRNININAGDSNYVGFFGYTYGATIKYLKLENVTITGSGNYYGGLVGYTYNGMINNCYVENVKINVTSSNSFRHGGIVGFTSGSNTQTKIYNNKIENVEINGGGQIGGIGGLMNYTDIQKCIVFGDLSLNTDPLSSYANDAYGIGYLNTTNSTTNLIGVQNTDYPLTQVNHENFKAKYITDPTDINEYITDPNNDWGGNVWYFGEDSQWDKRDGEVPHFTFYGTPKNPVPIYTYEDIQTKMMNGNFEFGLNGAFKLMNDIEFPETLNVGGDHEPTTGVVMSDDIYKTQTFRGYLDGNGFAIKNIKHNKGYILQGKGYDVHFFYSLNEAVVKNLEIHWENIHSGNDYGNINIFSGSTMYSLIENVRIKVDRAFRVRSLTGLSRNPQYSVFRNIYINYGDISVYNSNSKYIALINDYGLNFSQQAPTIENVAVKFSNRMNTAPTEMFYSGTKDVVLNNIKGVVVYVEGHPSFSHTMPLTVMPTLDDFRDGSNPAYESYQKDWIFDGVNDPIQKVFVKILEKIEERLVESYSRIITGFNGRVVGKFKKITSFSKQKVSNILSEKSKFSRVKSFIKPITSNANKFKSTIRDILSHSKEYLSNVKSIKKSNKIANSFIDKIYATSFADMITKTLRNIKSFSKTIKSNTINTKIVRKIIQGFSKRYKSNTIIYKVASAITKSFSKPFTSKLFKRVNKNLKINSFSRRFFGKSLSELARKTIRNVMSFSRAMRSRIWRFSNKFQFVIVTVKGGMKVIVGNVDRFAIIKRFVKSHTKKLTSWVSMFYRVASPQEVYAFIKATFRKIKLFKRENETIINIKKHKTKISKSDK